MPATLYHLHSTFPRVLNYVSASNELHMLALPDIGAGPGITLVRRLPDPAPPSITLADDRCAQYTDQQIHTEYDPRLRPMTMPTDDTLAHARELVQNAANGLTNDQTPRGQLVAQAFADSLRALQQGAYAAGARQLKGLGPGLTPAGDDFLCGVLWALSLREGAWASARDLIYNQALGGNVLSNHFLRAARTGLFFEHLKNFAHAICANDAPGIAHHFQRVLQHGATSGVATAFGLLAGFRLSSPNT